MRTRNESPMKPTNTDAGPGAESAAPGLSLPEIRCFSRDEAATYLGIGTTLLAELEVPFVRIGRRCVYDRLDLDAWLEEHKRRGRARKEDLWPVKPVSTGDGTPVSGGSMQYFQTANAYAQALKPRSERKRKRF